MTPKVQVYTKSHCPYCVRAKRLLTEKNIPFEEINLDGKDEELRALRDRTNFFTVPQIFINGKLVGGYTELADLESRGMLERQLASE